MGAETSANEESFSETSIVQVDVVEDHASSNDLVSRLAANLSRYDDVGSNHDVIFEPSQVVIFQLKGSRPLLAPEAKSVMCKRFRYPKTIYLDQFLSENLELANQKRTQQREMNLEVQKLMSQRKMITHFNVRRRYKYLRFRVAWLIIQVQDKDTIMNLRASVHYYEQVADPKDDGSRQMDAKTMAAKLKQILTTLESEVQSKIICRGSNKWLNTGNH